MNTIKICPNCGSTNVELTTEKNRLESMDKDLHYYCYDCHFEGLMPEITKEQIAEFRKNIKDKDIIKPEVEKDEPLWKKVLIALFIICTGILPGLIIVLFYNKMKKRKTVGSSEINDEGADEIIKKSNK